MTARVSIILANQDKATYRVNSKQSLLKSLIAQGVSLPYGCKYGGCISCAAKLLTGEVAQPGAVALNQRQLNDGYVLLCVARPLTDCVMNVGVQSHDTLYRNPFADPLHYNELKPDIATPVEPNLD